ncbi:rCG37613 [Rattus norvegicus]|uniref:RCG37613 n=1 Tax=Rattus norvegicus TaxID=10116 RepID=A6K7X1_RAT|nr:rCG37613 [Rattus norvegicus]
MRLHWLSKITPVAGRARLSVTNPLNQPFGCFRNTCSSIPRYSIIYFVNMGIFLKIWNTSRICVSSPRRGHADLLCILPILVYELLE